MSKPPCFAHADESLYESNRLPATNFLKEKIDYSSPSNVNTVTEDGMFIERSSLKEKSSTSASFARHILIKLLKITSYRLDLCFDIYKSPSIKDINRKSQGDRDLENIYNFGPRQSLPADFVELLNTSEFKTQFLRFLFEEYEDPIYGQINGEKNSYCSIDNECKKFCKNHMFQFEEVHELHGNHLEVNFCIKFHVNHAYKNGNGNIIVRVTDTDITIILTCNANLLTNIHL